MVQQDIADRRSIAGNKIDDSRRQPRRFEQFKNVVVTENRRAGGFPYDGVPHDRGRGRKISADRSEVERRNRVNETFKWPVIQAIPHSRRVERLITVDLLGEVNIEAQEIDRFAHRVDFRLMRRFALIEHRRGIDRLAPCGREQVSSAQKYRCAILEGPRAPFAPGLVGSLDRLFHFPRPGFMPCGQDVSVTMRHHLRRGVACTYFLSIDDQRNLDLLGRHRCKLLFQRLSLCGSGRIRPNRLVYGKGNSITTHDSTSSFQFRVIPRRTHNYRITA